MRLRKRGRLWLLRCLSVLVVMLSIRLGWAELERFNLQHTIACAGI